MSDDQTLPVTSLTVAEVATMVQYQAFLKAHGLERTLTCQSCGKPAEAGTGEVGWKCDCRLLVWRVM